MIGNQLIGDPPTSIIRGSPKAAPPKPSPDLTKPDQEKIKATSPSSKTVKLMFSFGMLYRYKKKRYYIEIVMIKFIAELLLTDLHFYSLNLNRRFQP